MVAETTKQTLMVTGTGEEVSNVVLTRCFALHELLNVSFSLIFVL